MTAASPELQPRRRPGPVPRPARPPRSLRSLILALKAAGIRGKDVAQAAQVNPNAVSQVLSGRGKSQRIVDIAKRLIAERTAASTTG